MNAIKQLAGLAMVSSGYMVGSGFIEDRNRTYARDLTFIHTPEPLSKRAKRRMRGKGKQP